MGQRIGPGVALERVVLKIPHARRHYASAGQAGKDA
jgi:hypothetical protein